MSMQKRIDEALELIVKKMTELENKRTMMNADFNFWSYLVGLRLKLDPKFHVPSRPPKRRDNI